MSALVPATLAFDASGAPYSENYGDIYHSIDSGPGQAQHVFLQGNGLPERWKHQNNFVIVETGFGLGLNFLATWNAWRNDPDHCERLHFISIEKHPFTREALATLHARYPLFAAQAGVLQAAYPTLVPGLHRREFANAFESGRVVLTLAFGDVADVLPKLRCVADAIYLDGFAPEKNPAMWTPENMKALTRISKTGTTFATYTAARSVRDALQNAGFTFEKRAGFGRKRDMLVGKYEPPPYEKRRLTTRRRFDEKRAIVIGAGLAGAGVAERLAVRGWRVEIVERHKTPAQETSGLYAGVFHPHISPDDALLSRLTRAGFLYAREQWQMLSNAGANFSWQSCGVLQIAKDDAQEARLAAIAQQLGLPKEYAEYAPRKVASRNAGFADQNAVARGGWWFPQGGWMRARELVTAQLAASNIATRFNTHVHALTHENDVWHARDENGDVIASAPVVILANAHDAARLANIEATMQSIRGQISLLDARKTPALSSVVCGDGYVLPAIDGLVVAGATYDTEDENEVARDADDASNLAQVRQLFPTTQIEAGVLKASMVGFRCVAHDRMAMVGNLPDVEAARAMQAASPQQFSGAHLADLPRLHGLYGAFGYASRGLTWASLAGEVLASEINHEPAPIENDLLNAIDPARFVLQKVRRGTL